MRFQRLLALIGEDSFSHLKSKTVMVCGIGGVGSFAAEALARSGIGHLILVDSDVVDITNVNRQIIAMTSTFQQPKVDVMASRIRDINPDALVTALNLYIDEHTINHLMSFRPDFVVDAIDSIASKCLLISICLNHQTPIISSMGFALKLHPEFIQITKMAKTETDPLAKEVRYRLRKMNVSLDFPVVYSKEQPKQSTIASVKLGSSAFVPPVAGLMMASYVVNSIIEKE